MCSSLCSFSLCEEDISAMEMEDDKRDLISREISKFRDTHKVTCHSSADCAFFVSEKPKKFNPFK